MYGQPEDAQEYLRKLAEMNACEGVAHEPRVYYNRFDFSAITDVTVQQSLRTVMADPSVYYNGESTPVRITHIVAAMDPIGTDEGSPPLAPVVGDERIIQQIGMRVRAHDTYYMNRRFLPLPLWHNTCSAMPQAVTQGTSAFKFAHPIALGQRDALLVDAILSQVPAGNEARIVGVSFSGVGAASKRPYRLSSTLTLSDLTETRFDPNDLKNDGAEVILIDQMVLYCSSTRLDNNPAGDIRELNVRISQTGNGTNIGWLKGGPIGAGGVVPACPASILGAYAGRCVVHTLPADGWLFQPGQGVTVELFHMNQDRQDTAGYSERVWVGLVGERILF